MMKNVWRIAIACALAVAAGAVGCERRDREDVGRRLDRDANRAEDRLEQAGKDIRAGMDDNVVTYEVATVDKNGRKVELHRANAFPGVTDRKDLQSGEMLVITFDELARYVEGDKPAEEIADELHVGENVTVHMGPGKSIRKISY